MPDLTTSGSGGMRLFGLIGYPLSQSFSKKYFEEKFKQEGLSHCRFANFQLSAIDELPALLQQHPALEGLAVTIPYKQQVLPFLHSTAHIPPDLDACNCIRIKNGQLTGFNTDHIGFEKSLIPLMKAHHKNALVLGNGGATAAVVFVLNKLGIDYSIVSRKPHHGSAFTYEMVDEKVMKENTLIINTTPLGMHPNISECPSIPYQFITTDHLLYDLVYNPEKTLFLQKGEDRGAVIKNGYEMLVLQAEENWRIWNE